MGQMLETHDLFDVEAFDILIRAVLPLTVDATGGLRMTGDQECKELWSAIDRIIGRSVADLTQEVVNSAAFPLLVHSYAQNRVEHEKVKVRARHAQELKESAQRIIGEVPRQA